MRNLALAAVSAAAFALVTPAVAQVPTSVPGVGIQYGNDQSQRDQNDAYRARAQADCRQVKTRTVRPNGTVVIRTRTRC
jgi:hypothetical protein